MDFLEVILWDLIFPAIFQKVGILLEMFFYCIQGKLASRLNKLLLNLNPIANQVGGAIVIDPFCISGHSIHEISGISHTNFCHLCDKTMHPF